MSEPVYLPHLPPKLPKCRYINHTQVIQCDLFIFQLEVTNNHFKRVTWTHHPKKVTAWITWTLSVWGHSWVCLFRARLSLWFLQFVRSKHYLVQIKATSNRKTWTHVLHETSGKYSCLSSLSWNDVTNNHEKSSGHSGRYKLQFMHAINKFKSNQIIDLQNIFPPPFSDIAKKKSGLCLSWWVQLRKRADHFPDPKWSEQKGRNKIGGGSHQPVDPKWLKSSNLTN